MPKFRLPFLGRERQPVPVNIPELPKSIYDDAQNRDALVGMFSMGRTFDPEEVREVISQKYLTMDERDQAELFGEIVQRRIDKGLPVEKV